MARPLRVELSGGLYHVTSRGNRRESIYFSDCDREAWLDLLASVCERFNWTCHAYCLMDNHYHIVIETPEGNLSKGMRQLNGVYTQHINRSQHRVGHLFQGRYKAILVEKESHLIELSRYVVLNPVRASVVSDIKQWPWSNYGAMIGEVIAPKWLECTWILGQLGNNRSEAILHYIDFVRAGIGLPSIWEGLQGQIFLGSSRFVEQMQEYRTEAGDLREVPRVQRRAPAKPLEDYLKQYSEPKSGMRAAYQTGDYTLKAIADLYGVHYSTVSRAVR
jgi:putative transposase